jgi:hypothetical protein
MNDDVKHAADVSTRQDAAMDANADEATRELVHGSVGLSKSWNPTGSFPKIDRILGSRGFVVDTEWLYRFDSEWFSPQGIAVS